jgi:hypothetical protein
MLTSTLTIRRQHGRCCCRFLSINRCRDLRRPVDTGLRAGSINDAAAAVTAEFGGGRRIIVLANLATLVGVVVEVEVRNV